MTRTEHDRRSAIQDLSNRRGVLGSLIVFLLIAVALGAGLLGPRGSGSVHGQQETPTAGPVCSQFGGGPPYNFDTYEASRDRAPYLSAQRLAAANALLPNDASFAASSALR